MWVFFVVLPYEPITIRNDQVVGKLNWWLLSSPLFFLSRISTCNHHSVHCSLHSPDSEGHFFFSARRVSARRFWLCHLNHANASRQLAFQLIQQLAGNAPSGHRSIQRGQGGLETHSTNVFRQKAQALCFGFFQGHHVGRSGAGARRLAPNTPR